MNMHTGIHIPLLTVLVLGTFGILPGCRGCREEAEQSPAKKTNEPLARTDAHAHRDTASSTTGSDMEETDTPPSVLPERFTLYLISYGRHFVQITGTPEGVTATSGYRVRHLSRISSSARYDLPTHQADLPANIRKELLDVLVDNHFWNPRAHEKGKSDGYGRPERHAGISLAINESTLQISRTEVKQDDFDAIEAWMNKQFPKDEEVKQPASVQVPGDLVVTLYSGVEGKGMQILRLSPKKRGRGFRTERGGMGGDISNQPHFDKDSMPASESDVQALFRVIAAYTDWTTEDKTAMPRDGQPFTLIEVEYGDTRQTRVFTDGETESKDLLAIHAYKTMIRSRHHSGR